MGGWTGSAATNAAESAQVNTDGALGAWSSFGTLPNSIFLHAEAVSGGWLYVSGGNDGQNAQSAVYYAPLPAPLVAASTAPPTTTLAIGVPQFGSSPLFLSTGTSLSLSASDAAGVASTLHALDMSTWTPYAAPIHVTIDGAHWLRYMSVDTLGNQEPPHAASFNVDGTAPASTLVFGSFSGACLRRRPFRPVPGDRPRRQRRGAALGAGLGRCDGAADVPRCLPRRLQRH